MPDTVSHARPFAVSAHNVSRRFGETQVLNRVSLEIAEGSFVAIVGRSGSGKSTLLRLIAGLDRPDEGAIRHQDAASQRLMFQEPRLLPWKTVAQNVAIGLGSSHTGEAVDAAVSNALKAVGLADRANEWPGVLSGGQKQRVSLARALVSRPKMLALDEPLGALDALTRIDMQALVEKVWADQAFTAVLVTHDVAEAIALADRLIVIEHGGIGLDVAIDLPRPRRRGDPRFAELEERVLARLLTREGQ